MFSYLLSLVHEILGNPIINRYDYPVLVSMLRGIGTLFR